MGLIYQLVTIVLIIAEFYPWLVLTASTVTSAPSAAINKCPGSKLGSRLNVPGDAVNTGLPVTFRLRNEFKMCKHERSFTSVLASNEHLKAAIKSNSVADEPVGLKSKSQTYFTADGLLRDGLEYYYPEEYCIDEMYGVTIKATVCRPSCKRNRPCIQKCCPMGEVVDMEIGGCKSASGKKWEPVLYSNATNQLTAEERDRIRPHFINLPPNCKYANGSLSEEYSSIPLRSLKLNDYQLETIPMRLLKDGSLIYYSFTGTWENIPKDLFCIDGMQNFGEDVKDYTGLPEDQIVFTCVDNYNSNM